MEHHRRIRLYGLMVFLALKLGFRPAVPPLAAAKMPRSRNLTKCGSVADPPELLWVAE